MNIPVSLLDYMKVEITDKTRIKLCFITWPYSYEPKSTWRTIRALSKDASEVEVQQVIDEIIEQRWFIKRCEECNKLCVNGQMISTEMCQSCASSVFGVLY